MHKVVFHPGARTTMLLPFVGRIAAAAVLIKHAHEKHEVNFHKASAWIK